jgi:hypothetical protein
MLRWREAYERVSKTQQFKSYFGRVLDAGAFRFLAYSMQFVGVAAASAVGQYGTPTGPRAQTFPAGAVILGITATGVQAQTATGSFTYAPSQSPGRRDLFGLSFQYSSDENITPDGLTAADALLGSGSDTIFPAKELLIPPSQSILVSVASLTVAPALSVSVVFHCMVPRAAG